jgi:hypothetical protein
LNCAAYLSSYQHVFVRSLSLNSSQKNLTKRVWVKLQDDFAANSDVPGTSDLSKKNADRDKVIDDLKDNP